MTELLFPPSATNRPELSEPPADFGVAGREFTSTSRTMFRDWSKTNLLVAAVQSMRPRPNGAARSEAGMRGAAGMSLLLRPRGQQIPQWHYATTPTAIKSFDEASAASLSLLIGCTGLPSRELLALPWFDVAGPLFDRSRRKAQLCDPEAEESRCGDEES